MILNYEFGHLGAAYENNRTKWHFDILKCSWPQVKKSTSLYLLYITFHPLIIPQNLINIQYNIYGNKPGINLPPTGNIHSSHMVCK